MIRRIVAALCALALLPAAGPPADPPVAFGARPGIEQISLSPSGAKVAFIAPGPGQSNALYTVDAAGGVPPVRVFQADGNPERLTSCSWVSDTRLYCNLYMVVENLDEVVPISRVVAVDVDGRNLELLSRTARAYDAYFALGGGRVIDALPGENGAVLMSRQFVPELRQGTNLNDKREGLGVERVDTKSLQPRVVEQPKKGAVDYITDGRGDVRIMGTIEMAGATGYVTGDINYYYRTKGSRDWKPLSVYNTLHDTGFNPYAVDPDLDVAYGFKRTGGRLALYSVTLDGSKRESEIFAHPQVDVDGLVRIGRRERVVGATYATEKRQAVYFDPALKALGASLSKALPGLPLVQFLDSNFDETKLLIWAGSDTDPGRYYIFDRQAKRLNEIMLSRPELEGATLAAVKPITFKAADGTEVPAYLTLPPGSSGKGLPAIVMPHGGPGARDEWGFDWLSQYFASRGYAVIQPNFRGSSGYGDAWFNRNGFQSWKTAIGDVNDSGRWLVSQGIADPSKLAILGWSYGGYAALQSNVVDSNLFKAVVAIAPVTDLAQLKEDSLNWGNHRLVSQAVGSGPHVSEGSPAQNAGRFKAPVLMFHGERDFNVRLRQSKMMEDRLKGAGRSVELIVYPKLDHYLMDSAVRAEMLRRSDAFLRTSMGIK
ncbi:MAG TPA: S9 family peptidase [Allosphingosinicella sp.]